MIIFNFFIMCFIFGTTFLAIKIGVDAGAPPFMSSGIRFFLAGFVLFIMMMKKGKAKISLLVRKEMLLSGLGLTFGTFATLYWAEQYVNSGIAAVLSATGPMIILLIQTFIFREKFSNKSLIGCIIGFTGVILLLSSSFTYEASLHWILGCIMILLGEVSYACGALYSKRVIRIFKETSPIALNAAQMMYGGALLFVLSLFTEKIAVDSMISVKVIGSLLYLIIIGSMVGHSLFYWLVANTNPVFPSTWLYISPLIAITLGSLLNHEAITWLMAVGAVTIICGTILVNLDSLQKAMKKPVLSKNIILKKIKTKW
ncbi:EamA family transporter [Bacillus methanolicus]|uniref:DMT family transporter n=1 Tax=Bacillus methanolicus TaxID=1471 RepID=UPI00200F2F0A|nr:EamA family transporter [Bacillus methanolicus]UQD52039.1 EamA family transporter [Bacillus methanolicus]